MGRGRRRRRREGRSKVVYANRLSRLKRRVINYPPKIVQRPRYIAPSILQGRGDSANCVSWENAWSINEATTNHLPCSTFSVLEILSSLVSPYLHRHKNLRDRERERADRRYQPARVSIEFRATVCQEKRVRVIKDGRGKEAIKKTKWTREGATEAVKAEGKCIGSVGWTTWKRGYDKCYRHETGNNGNYASNRMRQDAFTGANIGEYREIASAAIECNRLPIRQGSPLSTFHSFARGFEIDLSPHAPFVRLIPKPDHREKEERNLFLSHSFFSKLFSILREIK